MSHFEVLKDDIARMRAERTRQQETTDQVNQEAKCLEAEKKDFYTAWKKAAGLLAEQNTEPDIKGEFGKRIISPASTVTRGILKRTIINVPELSVKEKIPAWLVHTKRRIVTMPSSGYINEGTRKTVEDDIYMTKEGTVGVVTRNTDNPSVELESKGMPIEEMPFEQDFKSAFIAFLIDKNLA